MNKDKFFLLSVMSFYIVAGVLACAFFFLRGSSLPETTELPQKAAGAPQETAGTLPEVSDAVPEPDSVETTPKPEPVYYAFTTLNTDSTLRVRQEPGLDAPIIARFSPGTTGYVLERGPAWSLVQSGDITGYVSNEYLDFREIPKEEYPSP